ncbi:MAG: hypothetical protein H7A37_04415 [Chlamydiales bacterium]|nr:hypothetical protein [Chlamydiia bacterium]MCP5507527.1 hypothetical protein [Chlamydiales bacterium]
MNIISTSLPSIGLYTRENQSTTPVDEDLSPIAKTFIPIRMHPFLTSFKDKKELLGEREVEHPSVVRTTMANVGCMSKSILYTSDSLLSPSDESIEITERAASDFFSHAHKQLKNDLEDTFPLAGINKCLGFVVVPGKRLVLLAVSQDRNPKNDGPLRKRLISLIEKINEMQKKWIFELTRVPSTSEYLLIRSLKMRTPHQAPSDWIKPRTRCVEVALMAGLCKAGRFVSFKPQDVGMVAFSGTLWRYPHTSKSKDQLNLAVAQFEGVERNIKYLTPKVIKVPLSDGSFGYLDVWNPCEEHCKIYYPEILAISASGCPATHFTSPRSDRPLTPLK